MSLAMRDTRLGGQSRGPPRPRTSAERATATARPCRGARRRTAADRLRRMRARRGDLALRVTRGPGSRVPRCPRKRTSGGGSRATRARRTSQPRRRRRNHARLSGRASIAPLPRRADTTLRARERRRGPSRQRAPRPHPRHRRRVRQDSLCWTRETRRTRVHLGERRRTFSRDLTQSFLCSLRVPRVDRAPPTPHDTVTAGSAATAGRQPRPVGERLLRLLTDALTEWTLPPPRRRCRGRACTTT